METVKDPIGLSPSPAPARPAPSSEVTREEVENYPTPDDPTTPLSPLSPGTPNSPHACRAALRARGYSKAAVGAARGIPAEIAYRVYGNGPIRVLLIMGLCMRGDTWEQQIAAFGNNPRVSLCVLDNRGVGESSPVRGRLTTKIMADDIVDLLRDTLRWTDPTDASYHLGFHIVGVSMGGMIAQELASAVGPTPDGSPTPMRSLTLVATHNGTLPHASTPLTGVFLMLKSMRPSTIDQRVAAILPMLYAPATLADPATRAMLTTVHRRRIETFGAAPLSTFAAHTSAVWTHHVPRARLQAIAATGTRVTVLTGDTDVLVRPRCSEVIADGIGGQLIILPDTGHGILTEREARVHSILWDTWASTDKPTTLPAGSSGTVAAAPGSPPTEEAASTAAENN
eukprot:TRINITY_DN47075_c0_g1_i1.p1 TRINITY_DN47075_c0_g1~~TRINITY_DN47075_c0_g1_i1.p1  ORF type:complete len:398 (+),score=56.39 TRINITY_DN47075_c0_g1_i1:80-1273(+)